MPDFQLEAIVERYQIPMSKFRMDHSIRVARMATALAHHWNVDTIAADQAGRLHDIAKEMTPTMFRKRQISLPKNLETMYQSFPGIWHAFAGPALIQSIGVAVRPGVLGAIKWHTTGRAAMTDLEKIIYVADFVEPGRTFVQADEIRGLAFQTLDQAVAAVAQSTIVYLANKKTPIYSKSISCYNCYSCNG